jgi:4-diphosphocytidyl-2-C-methyl-D-erythritol kinase
MLTISAPAKINLSLSIISRLDNGYHLLESLVVFGGVYDDLHLQKAELTTLTCTDSTLETDSNLVLKAHRAVENYLGRILPIQYHLEKHIPMAAGLGGGSSNAAAALKGLNTHYDLGLNDTQLMTIGKGIGADVPVCLYGQPCWMTGIGADITPIVSLPPLYLLLLNIGLPVATAPVFGQYQLLQMPFSPTQSLVPDIEAEYVKQAHNDLEAACFALYPTIASLAGMMKKLQGVAWVRLSGSGGTLVASFESEDDLKRGKIKVIEDYPDIWCRAVVMLSV